MTTGTKVALIGGSGLALLAIWMQYRSASFWEAQAKSCREESFRLFGIDPQYTKRLRVLPRVRSGVRKAYLGSDL